ncbi:hypothetical protein [Cystobacter ferrugineus]|uniref:Uncharacterized protein n=1 Tax=Cystobacter ferrugineus TaxID=83449 RepID=A0A1L9BBM0_9BACT|nr:hypothetical protein [Cystobacter ferrugineus]OJH39667.1 hypothetical protein BON30_19485 [Cystobacter ferrugineus]
MTKKKSTGYTEKIEHVQATRPEPWPGIQGRSEEREEELPTGTKRAEQADVTDAQRQLEQEMDESVASTRE